MVMVYKSPVGPRQDPKCRRRQLNPRRPCGIYCNRATQSATPMTRRMLPRMPIKYVIHQSVRLSIKFPLPCLAQPARIVLRDRANIEARGIRQAPPSPDRKLTRGAPNSPFCGLLLVNEGRCWLKLKYFTSPARQASWITPRSRRSPPSSPIASFGKRLWAGEIEITCQCAKLTNDDRVVPFLAEQGFVSQGLRWQHPSWRSHAPSATTRR